MDTHAKKLIIRAFSDERLQNETGSFVLPINPEKYEQRFKVEHDARAGEGATGTQPRFRSSGPEELTLDFVFDGTGTVYGYAQEDKSVPVQIQEFKEVVYDLQGDIHQPRMLKLVWTEFSFDCVLTDMVVTYTLFDHEGLPLRAKLKCSFLNYKETERRVREEGKSSPDLTHSRRVGEDDDLPLLTHSIYGTPDHYLEVALANELTTFRGLVTGTSLVFPPVAKSDGSATDGAS